MIRDRSKSYPSMDSDYVPWPLLWRAVGARGFECGVQWNRRPYSLDSQLPACYAQVVLDLTDRGVDD